MPNIELSQIPVGRYKAKQLEVIELSSQQVKRCMCGLESFMRTDGTYFDKCVCKRDLKNIPTSERFTLICKLLLRVNDDTTAIVPWEQRVDDTPIMKKDGTEVRNSANEPLLYKEIAINALKSMGFPDPAEHGFDAVLSEIPTKDGKPIVFEVDIKDGQKTRFVQVVSAGGAREHVKLAGDARARALAALNKMTKKSTTNTDDDINF